MPYTRPTPARSTGGTFLDAFFLASGVSAVDVHRSLRWGAPVSDKPACPFDPILESSSQSAGPVAEFLSSAMLLEEAGGKHA